MGYTILHVRHGFVINVQLMMSLASFFVSSRHNCTITLHRAVKIQRVFTYSVFKCSTTFKAQQCNNSTNLASCIGRQTSKLHTFKGKQNECKCVLVLTNLCCKLNYIVNCMGQCIFQVRFNYSVCLPILQRAIIISTKCIELKRIKRLVTMITLLTSQFVLHSVTSDELHFTVISNKDNHRGYYNVQSKVTTVLTTATLQGVKH